MHILLMDKIVQTCLQRQAEGDCPTIDSFSVENLENCIIQLDENVQGVNRLLNAANESLDQQAEEISRLELMGKEYVQNTTTKIDQLHAQIEELREALHKIGDGTAVHKDGSPKVVEPDRWPYNIVKQALATESNWAGEFAAKVLEEAADAEWCDSTAAFYLRTMADNRRKAK